MQGFLLTTSNKHFVLLSNKTNITDTIARKFINKICDYKNYNNDFKVRCLNDRFTLNDTKYRITKCEYEVVKTDTITYFKIYGKNFYIGIPYDEKETLIIFE